MIQPPLATRSEEHTSELQSRSDLVCRLLLEKKNSYQCPARGALRAAPARPRPPPRARRSRRRLLNRVVDGVRRQDQRTRPFFRFPFSPPPPSQPPPPPPPPWAPAP